MEWFFTLFHVNQVFYFTPNESSTVIVFVLYMKRVIFELKKNKQKTKKQNNQYSVVVLPWKKKFYRKMMWFFDIIYWLFKLMIRILTNIIVHDM